MLTPVLPGAGLDEAGITLCLQGPSPVQLAPGQLWFAIR